MHMHSFGYAFGLYSRVNHIAFVSVVPLDSQLYLGVESLAAESKTLTGSLLGDSSPKIIYSLLELVLSREFLNVPCLISVSYKMTNNICLTAIKTLDMTVLVHY